MISTLGLSFATVVLILSMSQQMGGFLIERRYGEDIYTGFLAMDLESHVQKVGRRRLYRVLCAAGFVLQTLTAVFLCLHRNTLLFGEMERVTFNICIIFQGVCLTASTLFSQLLYKNL